MESEELKKNLKKKAKLGSILFFILHGHKDLFSELKKKTRYDIRMTIDVGRGPSGPSIEGPFCRTVHLCRTLEDRKMGKKREKKKENKEKERKNRKKNRKK